MTKTPSRVSRPATKVAGQLCQFAFSDGRSCRMPRWQKHRKLCLEHARKEQQLLSVEEVSRELVPVSGEFKTASDVNHVLGKLFSLVAKNRMPRKDAVALAYIGQLLIQTLPNVRKEIQTTSGHRGWEATLNAAFAALPTDDEASDVDAEDDEQGDHDDADDDADDDAAQA